MALEAHLEKISHQQDYASICSVSAKIQLLDKVLKNLGV
jgi:hypothetical protein